MMIYFSEYKNRNIKIDIYETFHYAKTLILVNILRLKNEGTHIYIVMAIYLVKYNNIEKMFNSAFRDINKMTLLSDSNIRLNRVFFCTEKKYVAYEISMNYHSMVKNNKVYHLNILTRYQINPTKVVTIQV